MSRSKGLISGLAAAAIGSLAAEQYSRIGTCLWTWDLRLASRYIVGARVYLFYILVCFYYIA